MLQWMGGSRRKVTTSRKSTQKRQKQYFEQRKRQQQQQAAGQESYSDKTSTYGQHQNNNRSLDILSLLNFSTIAHEHKSSSPSARENLEGEVMTLNYQTTQCPPTIQHNKVSPADPVEFMESRTPSGYQVETVYPKKVLISSPGSQNKALSGNGDIVDQLKTASNHQISVLDLLGDDGPNSNLEGNFVHEAHVAFSVEGLGKVETETPVHSPQQPGRTFSYGCTSPSKVTRRTHLFKNFNSALDGLEPEEEAMMQDIDMHFYGSSLELPFYSSSLMDSYSNPKQKITAVKDFLQLNDNGSNLKNFFNDEEIFYTSEDKNEYKWNESSSFLDDNFLDEEECGLSWKNWHRQMDFSSANYMNIRNNVKTDFTFGGSHVQKKRACAKATRRFKILESLAPYTKNQISESDYDFTTPDDTWYANSAERLCRQLGIYLRILYDGRHTALGRNCDVRDVINQPAWSSFVKEDAVESLSLLSEESCSSSAVRGAATKKPSSNSMARQNMTEHGTNRRSFSSKCGGKNIYAQETHCETREDLWQWENINGPVKSTRISSPLSSTPTTTFRKKKGLDDGWLFAEEHTTGDINSGVDSFYRNSGTKESATSGCKLWNEDPSDACPLSKLHVDAKLSSKRSKCDVPSECSPCGSFYLEEPAFSQPFSHSNSFETLIFPNIRPRSTNTNLCPVSNMGYKPQESLQVLGFPGDIEFSNIPLQVTVGKDEENKSETLPTVIGNFELQEDVCNGSNGLSLENGTPMDALDSENSCSHFKEAKDRTLEPMESLKAVCSPEHVEETSSSVEIPDQFEGGIDGKEYQNDTQTSLPCQNGCTELDDSRPKERNVGSKGLSNGADTSSQVKMLESYVLQLLCVQVMKEAATQGTEKKV